MICGDFNIDMIQSNTHSNRLNKFCDDNGLHLINDSPTRVTSESATLIDLCLSNIYENKISCEVSTDDQISDHALLKIKIIDKCDKYPNKKREIKVWNKYNKVQLWNVIENELYSWRFVENDDINVKMNWLLSVLKRATEIFQKTKIVSTNDKFFDHNLECLRREKNSLYKAAQLSVNLPDSTEKWNKFKVFKNAYKNAIQKRKYEVNQQKLNRAKGDTKETWRILNSILCKENNEILSVKVGDTEIENDYDIANEFNQYFINSIIELNTSIPSHDYEEEPIHFPDLSFEFRCVSITEIKTCLYTLKNNTDEYFLNPSVLLDAIFVVGQQLVEIINESFEQGIFPEALKQSKIIPVQKKIGNCEIANHRPINLLPCIERLIEKLAYNQFSTFINENHLLNDNQSGFRPKHSCETAINDVLYEWKSAQNQSKVIIAVFLDFQRAFETIDTNLLAHKLTKYGVSGSTLEWFKSYLNNRKQTVKIGTTSSIVLQNNLGVPQGSILGPLLFIMYVNVITKCLKHTTAKMFADDTLIFITDESIERAVMKLNEDLDLLYNKLCQNKLKLNVNKTNVIPSGKNEC